MAPGPQSSAVVCFIFLPASRKSAFHRLIDCSETCSRRAASVIGTSPASTASTILDFLSAGIVGGRAIDDRQDSEADHAHTTGLPESLTRDTTTRSGCTPELATWLSTTSTKDAAETSAGPRGRHRTRRLQRLARHPAEREDTSQPGTRRCCGSQRISFAKSETLHCEAGVRSYCLVHKMHGLRCADLAFRLDWRRIA